jgi:phage baseplate assembly protein W
MPRADRQTETAVQQEFFSDFSIDFSKNPVTGALARLTNENAVKQSIKLLVLSTMGEWPHANRLGSQVNRLLFDPNDNITASAVDITVREVIKNYEPRVDIVNVAVTSKETDHAFKVDIIFSLKNSTAMHSVAVLLKRVR